MSIPKITTTPGGFVFVWDEGIEIAVSRLRVHNSDGRVTGEVLIKNQKAILYPQTQLNFSSDRTRGSLTKALIEKYSKHDWDAIIGQLAYHVQEKAREGEPVIELGTNEDVAPPQYLVYPFVMANQANILFGPPESGKTQFALLLCAMMMLPWTENPLGLSVPEKPVKVLWLDYEADRDTTLWNLKRITEGADLGYLSLSYRRCRMPLADDIEQISIHADRVGATCLVIDSAAKATGGDLDKAEAPTRFFTALDQAKCTSLILAHTSKGGEGRKSIYGSTFFEAYARSVWELKASRNGETMHIGLFDNKANFRAKLEPKAFSLKYDETHIYVSPENIKTIDEFMEHLSMGTRILAALKDGMKSAKELHQIVSDVKIQSLYVELARLYKSEKIIKILEGKENRYGLRANNVE